MNLKRLILAIVAIAMVVMACEKQPKPTPPKPNPPTPTTTKVTGVSLDKSSHEMIEGATLQLTATVAPADATNKKVSWSSSTPATATVDANGKVTAVKAGTTTITVTTEDQSKTATCVVTVTAPAPILVPVTGVTISAETLDLFVGETHKLSATVAPADATNKEVSWNSTNTDVVTVDATGNITAVAEGTAKVSVTTNDGGKTAESTITVKASPITAIALEPATVTLKEGKTQKLTVKYTPESSTASKEVIFASLETSKATVSEDGVITAVAQGTTKIFVQLKSNPEIQASCSVKVERDDSVKGITLNKAAMDLRVGTTEQLSATITPEYAANKNVTWSSSNSSIATVSNTGIVTGRGIGVTTIKATTEDGSFIATCQVTVAEKIADLYYILNMEMNRNGYFYKDYFRFKFVYDDLYSFSYNRRLYKNHTEILNVDSHFTDFRISLLDADASGYIYMTYYDWKDHRDIDKVLKVNSYGDYEVIELNEDVKKRDIFDMKVTESGNLYVLCRETDAFDNESYMYYKVIPSGFPFKHVIDMTDVDLNNTYTSYLAFDAQGDVWISFYGTAKKSVRLYKNNVYQYSVSIPERIEHYMMKFFGGDCWIAYTEININDHDRVGDRVIYYLKNGVVESTFNMGNDQAAYYNLVDFTFDSKGNMYRVCRKDLNDERNDYVYRNDELLFSHDLRISDITVRE